VTSDAERRAAAVRGHLAAYGDEPTGIAFAPGRVNLIGEHIDYNGGLVLPVALQFGTTCTVSPRDDGALHISSASVEGPPVIVPVDDLETGARQGWSSYVVGAFAQSRSRHDLPGGASLHVDGDVPLGAGLSSSASLECAVLVALDAATGLVHDPLTLALSAQAAEHQYAGVPCGIMDQAASMLGRADHALLLDSATLHHEHVPLHLREQGVALVVVNTRAHHELTDGGYAERRAACERAASMLGEEYLVDADLAAVEQLPEPERRRARHVVTEQARVRAAVRAFGTSDLATVGELFAASHASLRDDFEVSCVELDLAVAAANSAGALASRMTGGGFGGSTVSLVRDADVARVTTAVHEAFAAQGLVAPEVLLVDAADGARALD
jgi:galactokinase